MKKNISRLIAIILVAVMVYVVISINNNSKKTIVVTDSQGTAQTVDAGKKTVVTEPTATPAVEPTVTPTAAPTRIDNEDGSWWMIEYDATTRKTTKRTFYSIDENGNTHVSHVGEYDATTGKKTKHTSYHIDGNGNTYNSR